METRLSTTNPHFVSAVRVARDPREEIARVPRDGEEAAPEEACGQQSRTRRETVIDSVIDFTLCLNMIISPPLSLSVLGDVQYSISEIKKKTFLFYFQVFQVKVQFQGRARGSASVQRSFCGRRRRVGRFHRNGNGG